MTRDGKQKTKEHEVEDDIKRISEIKGAKLIKFKNTGGLYDYSGTQESNRSYAYLCLIVSDNPPRIHEQISTLFGTKDEPKYNVAVAFRECCVDGAYNTLIAIIDENCKRPSVVEGIDPSYPDITMLSIRIAQILVNLMCKKICDIEEREQFAIDHLHVLYTGIREYTIFEQGCPPEHEENTCASTCKYIGTVSQRGYCNLYDITLHSNEQGDRFRCNRCKIGSESYNREKLS